MNQEQEKENPPIDRQPAIHLQDNETLGEADCGCLLFIAEESGNAAFAYCKAHDQALDPSTIETATFTFDHTEARGKIKVVRETYGLAIFVNGESLALVDLFNNSPERKNQGKESEEQQQGAWGTADRLNQGHNSPQIVIYNGDGDIGPAAYVRWRNGQSVIHSLHPAD